MNDWPVSLQDPRVTREKIARGHWQFRVDGVVVGSARMVGTRGVLGAHRRRWIPRAETGGGVLTLPTEESGMAACAAILAWQRGRM